MFLLLALSGCTSAKFTVSPDIGGKEIVVSKTPPFFYVKDNGHTSPILVKKNDEQVQVIQASVNENGMIALEIIYHQPRDYGHFIIPSISNAALEPVKYYVIFISRTNEIKVKELSALTKKEDWVNKNKIQFDWHYQRK